jgi:hypothetical protein
VEFSLDQGGFYMDKPTPTTEGLKNSSDNASRRSSFDATDRQRTLNLELKVQELEGTNRELMSEINRLKEEAKKREKGVEFADVLTQSPVQTLQRSDTTSSFLNRSDKRLTDLTVYGDSDADNDDKPKIEEKRTQKNRSKNQESTNIWSSSAIDEKNLEISSIDEMEEDEGKSPRSTQTKNPFMVDDITQGEITAYKLHELHEHYQKDVRKVLSRVDHLSSIKLTDNEIGVAEPEDTSKYIRDFIRTDAITDTNTDEAMSKAIANMESDLKLSETFRKKGAKSLNYMVKRANDHDLDILASLTVAHLKKLADIPDEKIPDIWKKVREFYKLKRFEGLGKLDEEKFITLKRYIERQRVNEKGCLKRIWGRAFILSSYIVAGPPRFWITKRELKQELAIKFGLEQERDDFLKEKEARKSNTKAKSFIRNIRGLRPHDQRIERPRGRYGKEQGELREIRRFKEHYQRAIDDIQRFQLENDFVYKKIERHILDFCEKCGDQERANKAFKALADYKTIVTKEGERLNLKLNKLHLQFQAEIQGMEKRIKGIIEKVTWNDFFSIGYGPGATTAGTVLTVLPFAGVAV